MPLPFTNLAAAFNAANWFAPKSYTPTISPSADAIILLAFAADNANDASNMLLSVTSPNLTWTFVASREFQEQPGGGPGVDNSKLWVYKSITDGSPPTSEIVTITISGTSGVGGYASWVFDEITDGNTTSPVVQSTTAKIENGGSAGISVALAAFANSANHIWTAVAYVNSNGTFTTITEGSGFTQLAHTGVVEGSGVQTQHKLNDTTGEVTSDATSIHTDWGMIGLEISAESFTSPIIGQGVGTGDVAIPIDLTTHDDVNTDHSDFYRSLSSPASGGSVIQNDITPVEGDTIIDNVANSTSAPLPNTIYHHMLRDYEDAGELAPHDSNDTITLTAPAHPTGIALVQTWATAIRVGWTDQTADAFPHLVLYRLKTTQTWILGTPTGVDAGTDEYTVMNLLPGVYEFHVRAWNQAQGLISSFDQILEAQTATELAAFQCNTFQYDAFQVREPSFVHPSDDVAIGNWADELSGTTDIFGSIDEDPAVDSDYVTTLVVSTDDIYRFRLEPVGDRPCDQGYVLQYRIEKEGTGTVRMIFDIIKEDLTVIVTKTHASVADAITEDKIELTSTQVATLKAANWFASPLVQVTADNGT